MPIDLSAKQLSANQVQSAMIFVNSGRYCELEIHASLARSPRPAAAHGRRRKTISRLASIRMAIAQTSRAKP
jgi:hypothetical protein